MKKNTAGALVSSSSIEVSLDDLLISYPEDKTGVAVENKKNTGSGAISVSASASVLGSTSTLIKISKDDEFKISSLSIEANSTGEETVSVAGLCRSIGEVLQGIGRVSVIGEVSNFKGATSKGAFFCIKGTDETSLKKEKIAVINVSVWSAVWNRVENSSDIEDGVSVVVTGTVRYYEPYGRISIVAERIELAGEGVLRRRFRELYAQMVAEGLFAPERKKAMPASFRRVALMTARQGQAVRDVLNSIVRQDPFMEVYLFPCLVQGRDAPESLIQTLKLVNEYPVDFDAVLVVRGGGSFEDLDCFNDERWVRFAAEYNRIPMVVGVGHEGDHTLTEFLGDYAAITPTAAGQYVSRPMYDRIVRFNSLEEKLQLCVKQAYEGARNKRDDITRRLRLVSPNEKLKHSIEQLSNLRDRLDSSMRFLFMRLDSKIDALNANLEEHNPGKYVEHELENLAALEKRFGLAADNALEAFKHRFTRACVLLDAKSPLKVLAEGYTYTELSRGGQVSEPQNLKPGDSLRTTFAGGISVDSVVTAAPKKNP